MKTTKTETGRGPLWQVNYTDKSVQAYIPTAAKHGAVLKPMSDLGNVLDATIVTIAANTARYHPDLLTSENKKSISRTYPAIKSVLEKLREEKSAFQIADARSKEPAALTDPSYESRYVQSFAGMSLATKIETLHAMNHAQSSAMVRYGDIHTMGLPATVVELVVHRHQVNGHLSRSGISANYALRPTATAPLATGVDAAAAFAAGEAAMAVHVERRVSIELAGEALSSTIQLFALATGDSVDSVWSQVTA